MQRSRKVKRLFELQVTTMTQSDQSIFTIKACRRNVTDPIS